MVLNSLEKTSLPWAFGPWKECFGPWREGMFRSLEGMFRPLDGRNVSALGGSVFYKLSNTIVLFILHFIYETCFKSKRFNMFLLGTSALRSGHTAQKSHERKNRAHISSLARYIRFLLISSVFLEWNLRSCQPMLAGSALCAIPGFGQLKIQLCA
jgi:hypothetical protein